MKFELEKNTNNSKKLFIGVSIIFCTVILIIGLSFAYFTQSDTKNLDSIVTANINDTLEYKDNITYMRQELIPAKESIAKQAYAIEGDKKCIDSNGYSACSMYEFNIKNKANVSQELVIDMIPTVNTFTNLHFMLYEIDDEGNSTELINSQKLDKLTEEIIQSNNIPSYNLRNKLVLNPNNDKTYQVVFYINDTGTDQTLEDAGKQFGGTIKISSVATGQYIAKSFGTNCWNYENTTLTKFNGINSDGSIKEECTSYITQDNDGYYKVNVPSLVGGQQITSLGETLFLPIDINSLEYTPLSKVKEYNIEEGITEIKDGIVVNIPNMGEASLGTFSSSGYNFLTKQEIVEGGVTINLPNSLIMIGNYAFVASNLKNITIPSNVESIGAAAFNSSQLTSIKIPASVITIGNSAFSSNTNLTTLTFEEGCKLTTIGDWAFYNNNISSLIIPNSVTTIGNVAFDSNLNLTSLSFEEGSSLTTIGYQAFSNNNISSLIIPNSVTKIDTFAFRDNTNLTSLVFEEGSNLTEIGNSAFSRNNISSLIIPNTVTTIDTAAFSDNTNLTSLVFEEGSNLTEIGDSAFSNNNISSLIIPNTVTKIWNSAFKSNKNLTSLTFEKDSKLLMIGDSAFIYCDLTYTDPRNPLIIPDTVNQIGDSAFQSICSSGSDEHPHNRNLKYIKFNGTLLEDNPNYWYISSCTTLNPVIE